MNFNTYNTQNNIYINEIFFSYKQFKVQETNDTHVYVSKDNQPFLAASTLSHLFFY